MKLQTFIFALCLLIGCTSNPNGSEYLETQQLIIENREDIFKIVSNSQPQVKAQMMNYLNLCINNDEAGYLDKSGKGRRHMKEFMKTVRFFVAKVEEAKRFQPDEQQTVKYYELKGLVQRDAAYINRYILNRENIGNHTDAQRRRLYRIVMENDLPGYLKKTMVTEKEFDKNIPFLVDNWEKLFSEIKMYYELKDLQNALEQ